MKKISLLTALIMSISTVAFGATIVQSFDTGAISPGSDTINTFSVNEFDTSLGTLTKVTFEISVSTWGGSYTVINTTTPLPGVEVTGTMQQGISSYISGTLVPGGISSAATQSQNFTLPSNGSSAILNGPPEATPNTSTPSSADSLLALSNYEGTGTYDVDFHSSQSNSHTDNGSTTFIGTSASSQGFLTVTYEYTPVPEPTSIALLVLGCIALGLRRRKGLTK